MTLLPLLVVTLLSAEPVDEPLSRAFVLQVTPLEVGTGPTVVAWTPVRLGALLGRRHHLLLDLGGSLLQTRAGTATESAALITVGVGYRYAFVDYVPGALVPAAQLEGLLHIVVLGSGNSSVDPAVRASAVVEYVVTRHVGVAIEAGLRYSGLDPQKPTFDPATSTLAIEIFGALSLAARF